MPESASPTGQTTGPTGQNTGSQSRGEWQDWYERVKKTFDDLRASGHSSEEIFVTLYGDLKRLAGMRTARQPPGASMHATRLLGDLYVRLFVSRSTDDLSWESAGQFVTYVTKAMKSLLIDHARQFASSGRTVSLEGLGNNGFQISDSPSDAKGTNLTQERVERALLIDELLDRLENDNAEGEKAGIARRQADIVRLRLFLGYTEEETAGMLGCSSETVTKEFRKAKAKLASYARREAPAAQPDIFSEEITRVDPRPRYRGHEE